MQIFKKGITFLSLACVALMLVSISNNIVQAEEKLDKKIIYLNQSVTENDSIFNNENSISPGDKVEKEFYINNNNKFNSSINGIIMEGSLFDSTGKVVESDTVEYKDFFNNSIITFSSEGKELFKGTLEKFINLDLPDDRGIKIDKNLSKKCAIEYELSEAAGNSIMGMEYKFNIVFNYNEVVALVKTGQIIDFKALILIGTLLCGLGLSLIFKKNLLNIKSAYQ